MWGFIYSVKDVENTLNGEVVARKDKVDYSEITQTDAAQNMNLTRMGLIQLEKRAMKKFKQELLKRNINFKDLLK